jgi:hypothetical protein
MSVQLAERLVELVSCTEEACGHEYLRADQGRPVVLPCSKCGSEMILRPARVVLDEEPGGFDLGGMHTALRAVRERALKLASSRRVVRAAHYRGRAEAYEEAIEMLDVIAAGL